MASTKLDISELDFDAIKVNLKNFLSKQAEFSDYNFEGSGFAILIDLLKFGFNCFNNGIMFALIKFRVNLESLLLKSSTHCKLLLFKYLIISTFSIAIIGL